MAECLFCYHCRRSHPAEEMRQVHTQGRKRWRCRNSLVGVDASREQRDAFGKAVAAANKARTLRPLPHCVREVLSSSGERAALR